MDPIAASEFVTATPVENRVLELQDFDRIVQLYRPRVFRFILASVRDRDAAETLTQDCFWRAYKGRRRFRGDSSVNTWLMRIAVNLVRDFVRNRRLQFWRNITASSMDAPAVTEYLAGVEISAERRAVLREQVEAVWEATADLSQRQRTVFLLRFVEEMDLLEIAAATGLTEGAVKAHLFRAVHAVRKKLRSLK